MIFNINSTRGQTRFLTCVARVTCLVRNKRSTKLDRCSVLLKPAHNSAQLRCFENGNDDFGVEAFWIGDAARVGYFVPLNGPLQSQIQDFPKEGAHFRVKSHVDAVQWGGGVVAEFFRDLQNPMTFSRGGGGGVVPQNFSFP